MKIISRQIKIRRLKKELDALWSKAVRLRDGACMVCGTKESLQAHHCIVRKAHGLGVRWLLSNGVTLCYRCHLCELHGLADKDFLDKYLSIINDKISMDVQEEIKGIAVKVHKFEVEDLEMLKQSFQRMINDR